MPFTFAPQFFKPKKQSTMKKFFAIAVIATSLVACGDAKNAGEEATKAGDTAAAAATQTATEAAATVDTTVKAADSTVKAVVDSTKK